jgi:hypothetical protein
MRKSAVRKEMAPVAQYLSYNGTSGKKNPSYDIWKKAANKRFRDAKAAEKKVWQAETKLKQKAKKEQRKTQNMIAQKHPKAGDVKCEAKD